MMHYKKRLLYTLLFIKNASGSQTLELQARGSPSSSYSLYGMFFYYFLMMFVVMCN